MYFKTETHEYRTKGNGWEERELGTKNWKEVAKNLWKSIYNLRKSIMRDKRPNLAETARIRLNKSYNEQTKKTSPFAYVCGIPLDDLIVHNK